MRLQLPMLSYLLKQSLPLTTSLQKVCQSEQIFVWGRKMMKNFDREKVAK
jgi:hypothetical protein